MRSISLLTLCMAESGCFVDGVSEDRVADLVDAAIQAKIDNGELMTPAQAAELYQPTGEYLTQSQADARYVTQDLFDESITLYAGASELTVTSSPELLAALDDLQQYRIPSDQTVTIHLADGEYTFSDELRISHPQGNRILIVGNTADPSAVRLTFDGGTSGVVVTDGDRLGGLDGVEIVTSGHDQTGYGVLAEKGALVTMGGSILASGWNYAMYATTGALMIVGEDGPSGIYLDHNYGAIGAEGGAMIVVGGSGRDGLHISDGSFGLRAANNAWIDANLSHIDTTTYGVHASDGGFVSATYSEITDSVEYGVYCGYAAEVNVSFATVSGGQNYGIVAESGALVRAESTTVSGSLNSGVLSVSSVLNLDSAHLSSNVNTGVTLETGSVANMVNTVVDGTSGEGLYATWGSVANFTNGSGSGNGASVRVERMSMVAYYGNTMSDPVYENTQISTDADSLYYTSAYLFED